MNLSFPQSEHLKKRSDFGMVLKNGQNLKLKSAKIYGFAKNTGPSKLGLIVGKKVGNAPKRNLIKRKWKEAFRLERTHFSTSIDVVVKVFPGFNPENIAEIKTHIRELHQCCVGHSSD